LYQTVILLKEGYINIYGHISYVIIRLYMLYIFVYIYLYIFLYKKFFRVDARNRLSRRAPSKT